ncbi:MAG: C-GCAxxG-C-C family protein [Prevotellaceae bacterium]|nr:C-GCAxxG-C-C family protein [Prevotellaceae bacterium]MDO4932515.1 C-GCAxxG-C-C family protein [Prevotellaceae bacterium]
MDWKEETERRVAKGVEYFKQGYNCSQSVTLAFADWYGVPEGLMARISASFGGGIGRMRETCGTASGMFMLAGLEIASEKADKEVKALNYKAVQELAAAFKEQTGSLICRELLKGYVSNVNTNPTPDERTDEYYRKRPCVRMVELAIRTYMDFLCRRAG